MANRFGIPPLPPLGEVPYISSASSSSSEGPDSSGETSPSPVEEEGSPGTSRPKNDWNLAIESDRLKFHGRGRYFQRRSYGSLKTVQRLEYAFQLEGHRGCVNDVSFNSTGELLASGSDDRTCIIWDWAKATKRVAFKTFHRENIFQTKFVPHKNDRLIVSSSAEGAVRLHDLGETGSTVETRKIGYHRGACHKVAMHPAIVDVILSAGGDGLVNEIDLRTTTPTRLVEVKKGPRGTLRTVDLYSIDINPTKPYEFMVSGTDRSVFIYDRRRVKDSMCLRKLCPERLVNVKGDWDSLSVSCAVYNHDGSEILASYSNDCIYLFANDSSATKDTEFLYRYRGHRNTLTIKSVAFFGQRSEFVTSGSDCGNIFFWDKHTTKIVNLFHGDGGGDGDEEGVVNVIEPHPSVPIVATSGLDSEIKIFAPTADKDPDESKWKMHLLQNIQERRYRRGEQLLRLRVSRPMVVRDLRDLPDGLMSGDDAPVEDEAPLVLTDHQCPPS